jgi:hypothetical protein
LLLHAYNETRRGAADPILAGMLRKQPVSVPVGLRHGDVLEIPPQRRIAAVLHAALARHLGQGADCRQEHASGLIELEHREPIRAS